MRLGIAIIIFLAAFQVSYAQLQFEDGPYKTYYKTGEVKTEGHYLNDQRQGKWVDYYLSGQISKEYYYAEDSISSSSSYYEDGIIKTTTKKVDDITILSGYNEKGALKYTRQLKSGFYKGYSEEGNLKIEANYKNHDLFGVWKMYHDNGNVAWEVNYSDGYKNGGYKQFYENGQLKLEGAIKKEMKKGEENRYSEEGYLEWKGYYDNDKFDKTWTHFDSLENKISKIKFENGVAVNPNQSNIIEPTVIPDGVLESVPIYPGCEYVYGNQARKNCMSRAINRLINLNFNTNIALNKGLSGKYRISVIFKIGTDGKVFNVRARAVHPDLENEAIRIIKSLPKIKPGYQEGKPVVVPYSVPILFQVK